MKLFDIVDCSRAAGIFDLEKLRNTFNHHFIRESSVERLVLLLAEQLAFIGLEISSDDPRLPLLIEPLSDRSRTMREMAEQALPLLDPEVKFVERAMKKHLKAKAKVLMEAVASKLEALGSEPTDEEIEHCFRGVSEEQGVGMGKVAQPCRVAMVGTDRSPGIHLVVRIVGIDRSAQRIRAAAAALPTPE